MKIKGNIGRDGRTRTGDPLLPKRTRGVFNKFVKTRTYKNQCVTDPTRSTPTIKNTQSKLLTVTNWSQALNSESCIRAVARGPLSHNPKAQVQILAPLPTYSNPLLNLSGSGWFINRVLGVRVTPGAPAFFLNNEYLFLIPFLCGIAQDNSNPNCHHEGVPPVNTLSGNPPFHPEKAVVCMGLAVRIVRSSKIH
jgi:hypothetical protein